MTRDKSEKGSQVSPTLTHILSEGESTPITISRGTNTVNKNTDQDEFKGPTPLVSLLSLGLFVVWLGFHAVSFFGSTSYIELVYQFGLNTGDPQYYEYLTAVFTHGGFAHLFVNVIAFMSFGGVLHRHLGSTSKYLLYFFGTGVLTLVLQLQAFNYAGVNQSVPLVGASGAICALFGYFGLAKPNSKVKLFFIINMKAKNAMSAFVLISVIALGYAGIAAGNIAHTAHLAGLVIGIGTAVHFDELPEKPPIIDADYLGPAKQVYGVINWIVFRVKGLFNRLRS